MTADTALRPIDYNTWLVSDFPESSGFSEPPEYTPEDDDWYASQRAAYLPDDQPPF